MKTKYFVLIGAVSVSFAALPLSADQANSPQRDDSQQQIQGLGDLRHASHIIGASIRDAQDQRIGKIKDLGLDLKTGRIAEVIIATSGSMGEKTIAVPPESLTCQRPSDIYRLRVDRAKIIDAPAFDLVNWDYAASESQVYDTYKRFGVEPYFTRDQQPVPKAEVGQGQGQNYYKFNGQNTLPRLGHICSASKLLGTTAWNMDGEKLAKVDNFVLNLPTGRVVEVILSYGGFWGMDTRRTAIPPEVFTLSKDNKVLGLATTKDALMAAPHFKTSEWGYAEQPDQVAQVYSLYRVSPYFMMRDIQGSSGAENVRERTDNTGALSPIEKSNSDDLQITDNIHRTIMADDKLSTQSKDVKIVVSDGRVTLTGTVPSVDEKNMIAQDAQKFVSSGRVDNELEVRTVTSPTTTVPPTPTP